MKTISIVVVAIALGSNTLFAQNSTAQLGLNLIPLFERTLELNATLLGNSARELYVQGGYTFPTASSKKKEEFKNQYWEGKTSGAYLRLGGRALLSRTGNVRPFFGVHVAASYASQAGKNTIVVNCVMAPCPPLQGDAQKEMHLWSAGAAGGVRMSLTGRLAVDVGMQANAFIGGKPEPLGENIYLPGYGRKPLQAVATIQYVLKGQ